MNNYKDKDGMLMIYRAIIITLIALIVCWFGYNRYKPKTKLMEYTPKTESRDLSDVYFQIGPDGNIIRIR